MAEVPSFEEMQMQQQQVYIDASILSKNVHKSIKLFSKQSLKNEELQS